MFLIQLQHNKNLPHYQLQAPHPDLGKGLLSDKSLDHKIEILKEKAYDKLKFFISDKKIRSINIENKLWAELTLNAFSKVMLSFTQKLISIYKETK